MVQPGRTTGYIARFDRSIGQTCPFALHDRCRSKAGKKDPDFKLSFTSRKSTGPGVGNALRALANLAKTPELRLKPSSGLSASLPRRKLPVRGLFRASCLVIASAAMTNLRSIWRFQQKDL